MVITIRYFKPIFLLFLILSLVSCEKKTGVNEYLCSYIGFERIDDKIVISALISDIADVDGSLKNLKPKSIYANSQGIEKCFEKFTKGFDKVYFKAIKSVVLDNSLTKSDLISLAALFCDNTSLPLKCNVFMSTKKSSSEFLKELEASKLCDLNKCEKLINFFFGRINK